MPGTARKRYDADSGMHLRNGDGSDALEDVEVDRPPETSTMLPVPQQ